MFLITCRWSQFNESSIKFGGSFGSHAPQYSNCSGHPPILTQGKTLKGKSGRINVAGTKKHFVLLSKFPTNRNLLSDSQYFRFDLLFLLAVHRLPPNLPAFASIGSKDQLHYINYLLFSVLIHGLENRNLFLTQLYGTQNSPPTYELVSVVNRLL